MKNKKILLTITLILTICIVSILNTFANSDSIASDFLNHKAEERAKKIDEEYGEGAYGGTAHLNEARDEAIANRESKIYEEGYDKGYEEGYDKGYINRSKEVAAERKKLAKIITLSLSILAIVIFVLLINSLKRNKKAQHPTRFKRR